MHFPPCPIPSPRTRAPVPMSTTICEPPYTPIDARPIFFYNSAASIDQILSLHLFEHRYRLMISRAWSSHKEFVFLPNYTNYTPATGDIGFIAVLEDASPIGGDHALPPTTHTLPRYSIRARLNQCVAVRAHWVEPGSAGLHYCRIARLGRSLPSLAASSALGEVLHASPSSLLSLSTSSSSSSSSSSSLSLPSEVQGVTMVVLGTHFVQ